MWTIDFTSYKTLPDKKQNKKKQKSFLCGKLFSIFMSQPWTRIAEVILWYSKALEKSFWHLIIIKTNRTAKFSTMGTCNSSYVTKYWQLKWNDRRCWGKHVYHVLSRCRCRVKSYLKVTLSPSRTVMLSGTCPNSAPCKLVPVKKKGKKKKHMSNSIIDSLGFIMSSSWALHCFTESFSTFCLLLF